MPTLLIDHLGGWLPMTGPLRGPCRQWHDQGYVRDVAVVLEQRPGERWPRLRWAGPATAPDRPAADHSVDAAGRLLAPGLVDAHTHAVFGGDRSAELLRRLAGESYQQIAAAGGGILHTVAATRAASQDALCAGLLRRLDEMAAWGTRVVEVKTGYGLDAASELRCLRAIAAAAAERPALRLVATAMPAHAVPPAHAGATDRYVDEIVTEHWPLLLDQPDAVAPALVDVFVEDGYFDVAQAARLWQAARALRPQLGLGVHVDEFVRVGGLRWAIAAGALHVSHLLVSDDADLAALCASDTVAVGLPLVSVFLRQPFARLRTVVEGGGVLAVASDCNPGSAMSTNLMLAAQMAVYGAGITPVEALRAVTRGGAAALGCPDGYDGSLRVGQPACAVLFEVEHPDALCYELGAPPRAVAIPGFAATAWG